MRRLSLAKAVLFLVLSLTLAVPAVQAAEPQRHEKSEQGFFSWDFVAQVWKSLTRVWEANGCGLDPSGSCLPPQGSAPEPDNGCGFDLDGRCAS